MQQFRRQRRWPRRRLLLQRLLPFRVLPRHAANGRQVSRPRDKTIEAAPGFPPSPGRRARAGRTLSSSFVRSFVVATPVTPGWKGGIGLPKGLQAMWSPVSLLTTCVVPITWFSQITGCCRRPLFGDLRRWVTNAGQAVGGMDRRRAAGPRTSLLLQQIAWGANNGTQTAQIMRNTGAASHGRAAGA